MRTKEAIIASRTAFINAANYALATIAADKEKEQVSIITESINALLSDENLFVVPSKYATKDNLTLAYTKPDRSNFSDQSKVITSLTRLLSKECRLYKNGACLPIYSYTDNSIKQLSYYGTNLFSTFKKCLEDKYFELMGQ